MPKYILKRYVAFLFVLSCACTIFSTDISNALNKPSAQQVNAPYQPAQTKVFDLIHTKLEVRFDWDKQELHGIATVQVKPHFYPQSQLILDARDFIIHHVALLTDEEKKEVSYAYDNEQVNIHLDHVYTREDFITVEITYTTHTNQQKSKNKHKLGANQGIYFINSNGQNQYKPQQIWTQGEPNTSSYWFPTIDSPNQRSTQELYITVEEKFKTLSNGTLVYTTLNDDQSRTDYWRMDLPHPPYLFMLAVGEFAEIHDEWNDIPVTYYVEPAYEKYATNIFKHTTEMLDFFSEKLDYPYPWPKYSQIIVRDYITGAMENTTAVVVTENIQGDDRALLDKFDREEIIAHELFHHWFGNLVTCESWSQLSLNESLASLGAHLWYAHKYGPYERDRLMLRSIERYLAESRFKQVSIIRNHYSSPIEMFDGHTYHKGALILHMLKAYLGEEAFLQALNQYLKKYAFSSTDIHQLRKSFEEISGEDLNWFFNQWFLSPGHPVLRVEHNYLHGRLILKIWQKQTNPAPIYQLPLKVDVWVKGEKQSYNIRVDKSYQEFSWPLSEQPEAVYIDKSHFLVGEMDHPQTTQSYRALYHYSEDFFSKHEAIKYFKNNKIDRSEYYSFFKDVLEDSYWMFREIALEAFKGYNEQEKDYKTIEEVLKMLTQDAHSTVRKLALETLATLPSPEKYNHIYERSLEDPSYGVVSSALYAYATYSSEEQTTIKETILGEFEDDDNIEIITSLAQYYTNIKKPDKYEWLKNKTINFYTQLGFEPLLVSLVAYTCAVAIPHQQEEVFGLLQYILENDSMMRIRLAAYHALKKMPKTKAVKKLLQDTKLEG
jgi:aminopeptidase N